MKMKLEVWYKNKIEDSQVVRVLAKKASLDVEFKDGKTNSYPEHQIVSLLNVISGRVKKDQGYQILIDKSLEQSIYKNFLETIWLHDGIYIYTGSDAFDMNSNPVFLTRKDIVKNKFMQAPRNLRLVSNYVALDDRGEEHKIGYSKMRFMLSSQAINHSKDQDRLNKIICKNAVQVNNSPNFKYATPEDGDKAITGSFSNDFDMQDRFLFVLKKGRKPSVSIRKLLEKTSSPYVVECVIAIQLIEYLSILDFLGDKEFDRVFESAGIVFARSKRVNLVNKVRKSLSEAGPEKESEKHKFLVDNQQKYESELKPGEILYIRNVDKYLERHPFGESPGHNLIFLGENEKGEKIFAGLFTEKRVRTFPEIVQMLIDDYNKHPHYMKENNGEWVCERSKLGGFC